jgi:hypothetical protein
MSGLSRRLNSKPAIPGLKRIRLAVVRYFAKGNCEIHRRPLISGYQQLIGDYTQFIKYEVPKQLLAE